MRRPCVDGPNIIRITMMRKFHADTPKICLQIAGVRMLVSALNGGPVIQDLIGGSVEKAKAANVSMIKLIHKS